MSARPRTFWNAAASLAGIAVSAIAVVGCASAERAAPQASYAVHETESTLISSSYRAADALFQSSPLRMSPAAAGNRVLLSTIVDLNRLDQTSPLGRLISEHVGIRFTQNGASVNELKLRGSLYISKNEGEFLLTRELKEISAAQNANFVLVGTYTESADAVYVALKLVNALDGRVVTGYNYALIKDRNIQSLLRPTH